MTATTSLVMKTRLVTSWDKSQSPPPSFTTRKPVAATSTLRHAMSAVTAAAPRPIAESKHSNVPAAARYTQALAATTTATATLQSRVPLPPPATRKPVAATTTLLPQLGDSLRRQRNTIATHSCYRNPSLRSSPAAAPPQHSKSHNSSSTTTTRHASQHKAQDPATPPQHSRPVPRRNPDPPHTGQYDAQGRPQLPRHRNTTSPEPLPEPPTQDVVTANSSRHPHAQVPNKPRHAAAGKSDNDEAAVGSGMGRRGNRFCKQQL
ncbi:hypothetical protein EDB89DRAFT_1910006 [Lactarius sanguifluus]|nr:hypothetical protein EDB89DRAFT_1910006 [Lactarius sanguifluus]